MAALQLCELFHHVSVIPMSSQPCNCMQMSKSSCSFPMHLLVPEVTSSQPSPSGKSPFPNLISTGSACPFFSTPWGLGCWSCGVSEKIQSPFWHPWCYAICWRPAGPMCGNTDPPPAHPSCREGARLPWPQAQQGAPGVPAALDLQGCILFLELSLGSGLCCTGVVASVGVGEPLLSMCTPSSVSGLFLCGILHEWLHLLRCRNHD